MATRRYKIGVGKKEHQVVEEAGAATNSELLEFTVDCATNGVAGTGTSGNITRRVSKEEVLIGLDAIKSWILAHNWPPV